MSILTVTDMTQGFGDNIIFDNVSFQLTKGEHIGLIGANGKGKTTFMKLITNEILPDSGTISWSRKANVGYMDQNVELNTFLTVKEVLQSAFKELFILDEELKTLYEKMSVLKGKELEQILKRTSYIQNELDMNDFYSINSKIEAISAGMGVRDLLDKNPRELSGGQRTKILLSKLLLEKPDILLLDEPTNHLDENNIVWLKGFLTNYDNAFILISHDTEFLNSVVNVIYHLENKKLTKYPGNYNKFLVLYDQKKKNMMTQYYKQQEEIHKLEAYIRKNQVRTATAAQAKSRGRKLEKIVRIKLDESIPNPHFNFKFSSNPSELIFETKNLIIGYDRPLTKPMNLIMRRNDKIALVGANGIGKTTLLKSLMAIITPMAGKVQLGDFIDIGYYRQEIDSETEIGETVLTNVWKDFPNFSVQEVRKIISQCGLSAKHTEMKLQSISGGEQAKVRLCKIINKKNNVLFLDEPTNHLDTMAKDELKRALIEYQGSIVLVSHEQEFYKDIVTKVWNCENYRV